MTMSRKRCRPSPSRLRPSRLCRKTSSARKRPRNEGQAHKRLARKANDGLVNDGTEAAGEHVAPRATNTQVGQDNAPAAENDTSETNEETIRAQTPTTTPPDDVGEASRVSGGVEARLAPDPQLASIQFIAGHKMVEEHYDLHCMLATGQLVWFNEADVQEACSPAVCTYWNCTDGFERPKDVVPPEVLRVLDCCPQEPDSFQVQMVGDPIFSGTDLQKKRFFEHKWIQDPTCKLIFNYKSMHLSETVLGTRWPKQYLKRHLRPSAPECSIQFIHGHRKAKTELKTVFQFSVLSTKPTKGTYESWVDERDLQLEHGAAVLTYWGSDAGQRAREAKKHPQVPDQPLRIHSHHHRRGVLHFEVHYVGKSACQKDLRSVSAATLKTEWEEGMKEYLDRHDLKV